MKSFLATSDYRSYIGCRRDRADLKYAGVGGIIQLHLADAAEMGIRYVTSTAARAAQTNLTAQLRPRSSTRAATISPQLFVDTLATRIGGIGPSGDLR